MSRPFFQFKNSKMKENERIRHSLENSLENNSCGFSGFSVRASGRFSDTFT